MLTAQSLTKYFGKKPVLENVSFSLGKGEIVGIVGPNGSGKTTLLNLLMGMINPTSGNFKVENNVKVGMSVSRKGFFDDMTVADNILMYAKLSDVAERKVSDIMKEFSIDFGGSRFRKLSAGMKQRVSLAIAFLDDYGLVLLDEPTNHLDIDSILKLRELITHQRDKRSTSFLITSHILSDLEKICDRIIFLKAGKLIRISATQEMLEKYGTLEEAYVKTVQ